MKPFGIIYKAINLINEKCYIGKSTTTIGERIIKHKYDSKRKKNKNSYFYRAIRKYGFENFKWETLIECSSKAVLNEMETLMIIEHQSHKMFKKGYNLTWGGDGVSGYKISEEHKRKLIELHKNNEYFLGRKHTKETKRKIGNANSKYQKGNNNSNYEHCWIYSEIEKNSISIKRNELDNYLSMGWIKGRKIYFN